MRMRMTIGIVLAGGLALALLALPARAPCVHDSGEPITAARPGLLARPRCRRLRLRGGADAAVHDRYDFAALSASTPSGESDIGKWSYESSVGPSSAGPAEGRSSEDSSTGLGIHGRNWSHVKALGIPIFEVPELKKVAKEAKLLRHAAGERV